jgi:DMSO/TMAO reductase YedYZ molybdopterin-dependent catalytic subunit
MRTLIALLICLFAGAAAAHDHAGTAPRPPVQAVEVVGVDGRVRLVDLPMLQAHTAVEVSRAPGEADEVVRWSGVPLVELLADVGAPRGESLRSKAMAHAVRVTATDGYQVVFSLAELDDNFGQAAALLAFRADGQPLAGDGPFRLVLPNDVHVGRWVRNVAKIELLDLRVEPAETN